MSKILAALDKYPFRFVASVALPVLLFCIAVFTLSISGSDESAVQFEAGVHESLGANEGIAGQVETDKDSYFLGMMARFRIRVLYRHATIEPDFESFKRNLGFSPFDQFEASENLVSIGNGISEYLVEYKLHIIGVRKPGNYMLSPAILPYTNIQQAGSNLHTLRIPRPDVHIASFYPWNVGNIPLRDLKQMVNQQDPLRQMIMLAGGTVFLLLAGFILWRFGRRRQRMELTEPEQLWQQFRALNSGAADNRTYLLACERIITRLLQHQIAMDPESFWSGAMPAEVAWSDMVTTAREILRRVYQPAEISDADMARMRSLLADKLAIVVEQRRLELEQQPVFWARFRQQKHAVKMAGAVSLISITMLVLAGFPELWLAPEIKKYNETLARIHAGHAEIDPLLIEMQAFAGSARIEKIRTAAFYNIGTLRATHGFGNAKSAATLLALIFQAESPDALLQTMLLSELAGSEEEVVSQLVDAAEKLLQSELDLQAAARTSETDEDVLRNLELVTKWRHAILIRLVQLRELFRLNASMDENAKEEIASDQGLINIIDAKLPEEYEDAEMAKDNSNYIIFERF